ncbi:MAG: hypothetical protein JJU37_04030 [Balneolaceae bacterium]|nr:hypothetical protein [Balneolaceae bacterium]
MMRHKLSLLFPAALQKKTDGLKIAILNKSKSNVSPILPPFNSTLIHPVFLMIAKMTHVSIYVFDQERAIDF